MALIELGLIDGNYFDEDAVNAIEAAINNVDARVTTADGRIAAAEVAVAAPAGWTNIRARADQTAILSIPQNVRTAIVTNVEDLDQRGEWDGTTFTAQQAGEYTIQVSGFFLVALPTQTRALIDANIVSSISSWSRVVKNPVFGYPGTDFALSVNTPLAAGDHLTVGLQHASPEAHNANAFVHIARIR